jgi:hypothetical protein
LIDSGVLVGLTAGGFAGILPVERIGPKSLTDLPVQKAHISVGQTPRTPALNYGAAIRKGLQRIHWNPARCAIKQRSAGDFDVGHRGAGTYQVW